MGKSSATLEGWGEGLVFLRNLFHELLENSDEKDLAHHGRSVCHSVFLRR